jgi:polyphosphate kinase 2 (PPK2 family)
LSDQVSQLSALQQLLYATNKHAVWPILLGIDAAGKDGAPVTIHVEFDISNFWPRRKVPAIEATTI